MDFTKLKAGVTHSLQGAMSSLLPVKGVHLPSWVVITEANELRICGIPPRPGTGRLGKVEANGQSCDLGDEMLSHAIIAKAYWGYRHLHPTDTVTSIKVNAHWAAYLAMNDMRSSFEYSDRKGRGPTVDIVLPDGMPSGRKPKLPLTVAAFPKQYAHVILVFRVGADWRYGLVAIL